jgi:aryl-alcohol dehydrogenase-like predicted oxidoreductase
MQISPITLGTVQLGLPYGIANKKGALTDSDALNILNLAWNKGINSFDTAPAYGESEKRIGNFIKSLGLNKENKNIPIIITKIPGLKENGLNQQETYNKLKSSILNSIKSLNISHIPICLLHKANDMKEENIRNALIKISEEGLIDKIGVSVYTPDDVVTFLDEKIYEAIQIPINVFDQRLIKSGLLKELKNKSKIIFARSIFLQGLFFLDLDKIPSQLNIAKPYLLKLHQFIDKTNLTIGQFALAYAKSIAELTSILIGVESEEQLQKNIVDYTNSNLDLEIINDIKSEFSEVPEKIIDPSKWN